MATYKRQPGDLAIQVYVPTGIGFEIGKLRLQTRRTNNEIVVELLSEALTARGLLFTSDELEQVLASAPAPETKGTNAGMPAKSSKPSKKHVPGPQVTMTNPAKSVAAAIKQARASQEQLAKISKAEPAPVEVTVADSVSVEDVAEVAAQEPVVAPAPLDELDALLDAAINHSAPDVQAPKVEPAPEEDDEIDFSALAIPTDEKRVVDPFALLDQEQDLVLDPFKLVT